MWYPPKKDDSTWRLTRTGKVWKCKPPPDYYEPVEESLKVAIAMLSTGLRDKNDKEIFDGDIIEFDAKEWGNSNDNKWVVSWDSKHGEWLVGGGVNRECSEWKTVIGNNYEHPELLE